MARWRLPKSLQKYGSPRSEPEENRYAEVFAEWGEDVEDRYEYEYIAENIDETLLKLCKPF